jgi:hypothetical protein
MSETGERDWAEWLTEGTWDVPALETREEFKAAAATALREYGDQREREAVEKAAKADCEECREPSMWHAPIREEAGWWSHQLRNSGQRRACRAGMIFNAFPQYAPNLDSREVKREGTE